MSNVTDILVGVDRLLSEHGFSEMASARHQLSIAISLHKQQLQQARREADSSAEDAFRRGWEQGKRECVEILKDYCKREMVAKGFGKGWQSLAADAIAAMDYKDKAND